MTLHSGNACLAIVVPLLATGAIAPAQFASDWALEGEGDSVDNWHFRRETR